MVQRTLMLLLIGFSAIAKEIPYTINSISRSHILEGHIYYLIDSVGLSADQVMMKSFDSIPPLDFYNAKNDYCWMKIPLLNKTTSNQFILTIDQWSEATLYLRDQDNWNIIPSGTSKLVTKRPISFHRLLSFPIVIPAGDSTILLLKVRITKPLMRYYGRLYSFLCKAELDETGHAYKKYIGNQLIVFFVLGVVFVLFIYNINLYFFTRDNLSLILSAYFIAIALSIANVHGIVTNYLITSVSGYEMQLALHLAHLTPIIIAFFLLSFFKWNKSNWETYIVIGYCIFITISWILSTISDRSLLYFERRYIEYTCFIVVILSAIIKRKTGAFLILLAILASTTTAYLANFKAVYFQHASYITEDTPYLFGIMIQVLIFSIGATYKVRELRQDAQQAHQEKQHLIEDQNQILKKQVDEKTQQLSDALVEMKYQKEELERINYELKNNADELHAQANSIKELNNSLEILVEQRTKELKSTMADLEKFLYRTSHDLRRPLMTILGLSNLMKDVTDPDKINEVMRLVNKTVLDLDRMLKKLIAIGVCYNEIIDKERINVHALINQSIETLKKEFADKKFQITFADNSQQATLNSNTYLLHTVLGSIFENAIGYGPDNVCLKIELINQDHNLVMNISDNGPGIAFKYLPYIFDMFSRANEKSTGNGLGLYLVKLAIEKLGGQVSVSSVDGNGTEVHLVLPLS